jgi:hypothetical protein
MKKEETKKNFLVTSKKISGKAKTIWKTLMKKLNKKSIKYLRICKMIYM